MAMSITRIYWSAACLLRHFLVISSGFTVSLATMSCNYTEVNNFCYQELHDSSTFKQMSRDKVFFPKWNDSDLDKLCRVTVDAEVCVQHMSRDCQDPRPIYNASEQVISFMCGEGREEYVRSRDCISSDLVRNRSLVCEEDYLRKQKDINGLRVKRQNSKIQQLCESLDEYLACRRDSVEHLCSDLAADWMHHVQSILFQFPILAANCRHLDDETDILSPKAIYSLIVGLLLVTAGVVIIILVLCRRIRHLGEAAVSGNSIKYKEQLQMKAADKKALPSAVRLMPPDSVHVEGLSQSCQTPLQRRALSETAGCGLASNAAAKSVNYDPVNSANTVSANSAAETVVNNSAAAVASNTDATVFDNSATFAPNAAAANSVTASANSVSSVSSLDTAAFVSETSLPNATVPTNPVASIPSSPDSTLHFSVAVASYNDNHDTFVAIDGIESSKVQFTACDTYVICNGITSVESALSKSSLRSLSSLNSLTAEV